MRMFQCAIVLQVCSRMGGDGGGREGKGEEEEGMGKKRKATVIM